MLNLAHKRLNVWKYSLELIKDIYKLTENFPVSEKYIIINQLRRAAISVASNIAEGSARGSSLERKRFFEIARSSLVEIDTQIEIASELGIIQDKELDSISVSLNRLFAMISKLIQNTREK